VRTDSVNLSKDEAALAEIIKCTGKSFLNEPLSIKVSTRRFAQRMSRHTVNIDRDRLHDRMNL
jgi:hypothetical protein